MRDFFFACCISVEKTSEHPARYARSFIAPFLSFRPSAAEARQRANQPGAKTSPMASRVKAKRMERESRRGDVERVRELIGSGADIDKFASDEMTPLMRAAYQGHQEVVEMLLERGADPNRTAKDGASALFWACVGGHEAIADMLLAAGANANAIRQSDVPPKDGGPSVLAVAIGKKGSVTLVQKLLRAGASLEYQYLGYDMPAYAAWHGRADLANVLKPNRRRVRK